MTETNFAKLFDTAHGQLLVTKSENDEGNPSLTIRADIDGITMELQPAWADTDTGYDKRDWQFDQYVQADADRAAATFAATLAKLTA